LSKNVNRLFLNIYLTKQKKSGRLRGLRGPMQTTQKSAFWGSEAPRNPIPGAKEQYEEMTPPPIQPTLSPEGFSNLERIPSDLEILRIKERCGVFHKRLGTTEIPSGYIGCMNVVAEDPDFWFLIKYDKATQGPIWDKSIYPSMENLKAALIARFACYGVEPGPHTRTDVLQAIQQREENQVNTILDYFAGIAHLKTVDRQEKLQEMMDYIHPVNYADWPMYTKAMDLFFTKAALHVLLAFGDDPYPMECIPVFVGNEGIRKTRLCRYLSIEKSKFYGLIAGPSTPFGSANFIRQIVGRLIVELGEMSSYGKSEVETVKAVVSETFDEFNQKFLEGTTRFPRIACLIGTSNNPRFLKEAGENRRWFPMFIKEIDEELLEKKELIQQIWVNYLFYAKELIESGDLSAGNESDELKAFFGLVRDGAVDIGVAGDLAAKYCLDIEKEKLAEIYETKKNNSFVCIHYLDVAKKVYGDQVARTPADFALKVGLILQGLGYKKSPIWWGGKSVNGWKVGKEIAEARAGEAPF
jgi:hypothetical protein